MEYYPNSYLVEGFDQPLLSVGVLLSNGFQVDIVGNRLVTKSGTVVKMNEFDVSASYVKSAAKLSDLRTVPEPVPHPTDPKLSDLRSIPEPILHPTDLVSRGKKEPKVQPPVTITASELATIELHMKRLGIPNVQRLRLLPD